MQLLTRRTKWAVNAVNTDVESKRGLSLSNGVVKQLLASVLLPRSSVEWVPRTVSLTRVN